jgi:predicted ATPase
MLFLESLGREGLLVCKEDTKIWEFNIDKIQDEMMITDSSADLLNKKNQTLPAMVQKTLKIASLLGYRFSEHVVSEIVSSILKESVVISHEASHSPVMSLSRSLSIALDGGFIEKTQTGFQFSHDKVQASFRSYWIQKRKVNYITRLARDI